MLLIVLFAAVLGLSSCADPQPCCVSHQFSSFMSQVGAYAAPHVDPTVSDRLMVLDYDYDRRMIRINSNDMDVQTGKHTNASILEDFANHKRYTLTPGHCYVEDFLDAMQEPCVPANSSFIRSYSLGSGAATIKVNVFSGVFNQLVIYVHVTDTGCVPVSETMYGTSPTGMGIIQTMNFGDFMAGNSSFSMASPFDLPAACKSNPEPFVGKRSAESDDRQDYRPFFML